MTEPVPVKRPPDPDACTLCGGAGYQYFPCPRNAHVRGTYACKRCKGTGKEPDPKPAFINLELY